MFQSVLNQTKRISANIKKYCAGLITTVELKNISSMARETEFSNRSIGAFFKKPEKEIFEIEAHQIEMVKSIATAKNSGQINIDDFMILKPHMYKNKGVTYDRSGATKRVEKGLVAVTAAWTDGKSNVQLSAEFLLNKKDSQHLPDGYIKKTTLALKLISWTQKNKIPFDHVALDGLYNSKECIDQISQMGIRYVTRFHKNRKVIIGGKELRIDQQPCFIFRRNATKISLQMLKISSLQNAYSNEILDRRR